MINDEYIKTHALNKVGHINPAWTKYIFMDNHPDIKLYLLNRFTDSETIGESVYRIIHNIEICPVCKRCGKPVHFSKKGYRDFCSRQCSRNHINYNNVSINCNNITIDNIIKDIVINGHVNINKVKEKYLIEHNYKDILLQQFINEPNLPYIEIIYRLYHNIKTEPICPICNNNSLKFISFDKGYEQYCSLACRIKDTINIDDTYIKKYLVNRGLRNQILHLKDSGIYDYLMNRFSDCNNYKEAIYRIKNNLESAPICPVCNKNKLSYSDYLYGYKAYCSIECENKIKRLKRLQTIREHTGFNIELDPNNKNNFIFYNCCDIHHEFSIEVGMAHNRTLLDRYKTGFICPICNPINNKSTMIELIIKSILDKHNIVYRMHDRTIIRPKEVDFYLPECDLCIECNGEYWHSSVKHDKEYHIRKYKDLILSHNRVLCLWESDIINKRDIIERLIILHCNNTKNIIDNDIIITEINEYNEILNIINKYSLYSTELLLNKNLIIYKISNDNIIGYIVGFIRNNKFIILDSIHLGNYINNWFYKFLEFILKLNYINEIFIIIHNDIDDNYFYMLDNLKFIIKTHKRYNTHNNYIQYDMGISVYKVLLRGLDCF